MTWTQQRCLKKLWILSYLTQISELHCATPADTRSAEWHRTVLVGRLKNPSDLLLTTYLHYVNLQTETKTTLEFRDFSRQLTELPNRTLRVREVETTVQRNFNRNFKMYICRHLRKNLHKLSATTQHNSGNTKQIFVSNLSIKWVCLDTRHLVILNTCRLVFQQRCRQRHNLSRIQNLEIGSSL